MKTTTILLLFASIILSLNSCIPTPPSGGINPTPQTDTTVIYREFSDSIAMTYFIRPTDPYLSSKQKDVSVDLDSNGIDDIFLSLYINEGMATAKVTPLNSCSILTKLDRGYDAFFNSNDIISNASYSMSSSPFYTIGANNLNPLGATLTASNKLLGFALLMADGIHYGWLNLTHTATFPATLGGIGIASPSLVKCKLNSMAFKIAPNTAIQAGKY